MVLRLHCPCHNTYGCKRSTACSLDKRAQIIPFFISHCTASVLCEPSRERSVRAKPRAFCASQAASVLCEPSRERRKELRRAHDMLRWLAAVSAGLCPRVDLAQLHAGCGAAVVYIFPIKGKKTGIHRARFLLARGGDGGMEGGTRRRVRVERQRAFPWTGEG